MHTKTDRFWLFAKHTAQSTLTQPKWKSLMVGTDRGIRCARVNTQLACAINRVRVRRWKNARFGERQFSNAKHDRRIESTEFDWICKLMDLLAVAPFHAHIESPMSSAFGIFFFFEWTRLRRRRRRRRVTLHLCKFSLGNRFSPCKLKLEKENAKYLYYFDPCVSVSWLPSIARFIVSGEREMPRRIRSINFKVNTHSALSSP